MQGFVLLDGEAHALALATDGRGGHRLADGTPVARDGGTLSVGSVTHRIVAARDGDRLWIKLDGEVHELVWQDAVAHYAEDAGGAAGDSARAPMPGVVVTLDVAVGAQVAAGDTMMIIESMKLETAIRAPRDGVVEMVHVAAGATFERDALLVSLEPLA